MVRRLAVLILLAGLWTAPAVFSQDAPGGRGRAASAAPAQGAAAAAGGRYIEPSPINFNDHAGWEAMFDGVSL